MPHYCVDANPHERGDRTIHDLTPEKCPHLPAEHRQPLGWHRDVHSAIERARLSYKAVKPCVYCCNTWEDDSAEPIEIRVTKLERILETLECSWAYFGAKDGDSMNSEADQDWAIRIK